MGIKETPTNFRVYFKAFKDATELKYNKAVENYNATKELNAKLYEEVKENIVAYKRQFNIKLEEHKEFVDNKYIDGSFYKFVKRTFINLGATTNNKYDILQLYKLSNSIKKLHDIAEEIARYNKIRNLTLKEYNEYLRIYFTEVHRQMILNGYGYNLGQNIGTVIINRCKLENARPKINYAATKANKAKLLEQGERLYNKEEEAWCKANGFDYQGKDYRVYLKKDYVYEVPLIYCKLPGAQSLKFELTDYRHNKLRGKSNQEILASCKGDLNAIVDLKLDIRTKLQMCLETNKMLYSKFIRNDAQQPIATSKAYRKN